MCTWQIAVAAQREVGGEDTWGGACEVSLRGLGFSRGIHQRKSTFELPSPAVRTEAQAPKRSG